MNSKHKLAEIERIAADVLTRARANGYDGPTGVINILNSAKIYDQAASDYLDWGGTFREFQYRLVKTELLSDTPYFSYMVHGYHTGFKYSRIADYVRAVCKEYGLSINVDHYLTSHDNMWLVSDVLHGYRSKDSIADSIVFESF